jgi:hypothetical protein
MFYILYTEGLENQIAITEYDLKSVFSANSAIIHIKIEGKETLKKLQELPLEAGDVICYAGITLRLTMQTIIDIAKEKVLNIVPGNLVDHREQPIGVGKFLELKPIEQNEHNNYPYIIVIGNAESFKDSIYTIQQFTHEEIWPIYCPEEPTLMHWLAAAMFISEYTISPTWFNLINMAIRNMELAPVMYAHNPWHDWISFYPAKTSFKLENHAQLLPVWLAESYKPLEYWK